MKITTKTRYGLRALVFLAIENEKKPEILVRIKDISETQNISIQYLEQILYKLKKADIIEGKRGPNGGYKMAKDPKEIKVSDVFDILESEVKIAVCNKDAELCLKDDCGTLYLWNKLNRAVHNVLHETTLEELMNAFKIRKHCKETKVAKKDE